MSDNSFWNQEDEPLIKCPYCGEEYEPSYEDTYIGHTTNFCPNCGADMRKEGEAE